MLPRSDHLCNDINTESGSNRTSAPLETAGLEAATVHDIAESSFRHAKYLPVPGGLSIGPGTNNRITGNRKNFRPTLKFSSRGIGRNPAINGPPITKSLFPSTITAGSRLAKRKSNRRSAGEIGIPGRTLVLNCAGGSPAKAVPAATKQSRKIVVFIRPRSPAQRHTSTPPSSTLPWTNRLSTSFNRQFFSPGGATDISPGQVRAADAARG